MNESELLHGDIEAYLHRHEHKTLLRFVIVGSVDDGKSTLIGRLLYDTNSVYEDQLAAVKKASHLEDGSIDLSLLTDGLAAEREQGITIDVAYRYFTTEKRKFIVADTPGHVQYTRNMVTGASTADVALILIDARLGVLEQSRRHAYLASLLGIPHLIVAVNKLDLVGYDEARFREIVSDFRAFTSQLAFKDVQFIPTSAYHGDNIVTPSPRTPWWRGAAHGADNGGANIIEDGAITVLDALERVPVESDRNLVDFRLPVQYVIRPNLDYRGFCGQIASGVVRRGDPVMVLPSGKVTTVKAIDTYNGELASANAPLSVTLRLADEVDCSRGDVLVHPDNRPRVARSFEADVVWLHERPLDREKTYLIKHTTQTVRVQIDAVHARVDLHTLTPIAADTLGLNEIGHLTLTCHRALCFDPYARNRTTGSFILIDSLTNATVGAGMIRANDAAQSLDAALKEARAGSGLAAKTQVSPRERRERLGQSGAVVWLTGLPGSGRWTLGFALERKLFDLGHTAHVIDPRGETLETAIAAARACADAGLIAICAHPSPRRDDRRHARDRIGAQRFVEVFVDTDPALCRERRPDATFEGFEPPDDGTTVCARFDRFRLHGAVMQTLDALVTAGLLDRPAGR
jgi:bifunctional enzyme CysN/CysC